ncbi:MAG: DUF3630 family protein [bacterium]|nr:DUF3630 family protein [bacterium]
MNIKWGTFTRPDGSVYRQVEVSPESDWKLFDCLATKLAGRLAGKWCERLDGLDQRYWDLQRDSAKITLHLEHYLGITVYPTDGANASPSSLSLLESAYELLANYDPPNHAMQTDRPSADR